MQLLFEEGGEIRAGTVLAQQGEAYQVELPAGKRTKVKAKDVLLQFAQPSAMEMVRQTGEMTAEIDLDFLWECAPAEEFGFAELAAEYYGADAGPVQQAALAMALHGNPIYFRRKGRGRYMRAPEDQLKAALAAVERKKQQALVQGEYEEQLKALTLPEAFRGKALQLLFKPDKNSLEYKAMDAACTALGMTPMRLMVAVGGVESPRALHEAKFLADCFPKGTGFPDVDVPEPPTDLPVADVQAFSIDDVTTTEIDDALSVTRLGDGKLRVGIHIAAPGLGIRRSEPLDAIARHRLSTVYFPGDKITMLPDSVVDRYTLQEGRTCPALSLYVTIDPNGVDGLTIVGSETRAEQVPIAANLRHNLLDDIVTEAALAAGTGDYPFRDELTELYRLANHLHDERQRARLASGLRPEAHNRADFNFYIDQIEGGGERVRIEQRRRGSPLDQIVAELMILANSTWGKLLADHGVPGIYRTQKAWGMHRTRMQTYPAPHEGLGVAQYAWSTSPLRRYVDLVNQWQIMAVAQHGVTAKLVAPFKPKDADLLAAVADFEGTYAAYADHQSTMERYWCLRWLKQENRDRMMATVLKDGAVRFTDIPLVTRVPELMQAVRGTQVLLEIATTDEISLEVSCRVLEVFAGEGAMPDEDLDTDEELDEASAEAAADAAAEAAAEDAVEGAAEGADAAPEDADSEASEGDQDDEASAPRDTGANPAA
ncbi:MAG: RNB domain-containing ribonuclease [Burkholderiaceae bacterium]|jgi:exoribonuclease II|uniref:RNB domain-containing ribonuclease n=1 Tax=Cupriavidus metallidurans TaxID=119219 RepID=A0A2L0XA48_9BURK|nr:MULTISPECIES: RNB domain-containing ribonuclease [Cupriavidus]PCH55055.1 MAG: RNB domain-containing ribonuclease [Burkholderiaceae bacterium]AVA36993.1 RNB domain-containing ribonuclease [Cupriavidus metallidurans]KWR87087.1 ribonuclease II [Cupriavidus sp. SHE]QBP11061.1 RNB domain-containing ribonuclease [Cupriavidus metallidurans]QWC88125.1 RNB domain-containing ribonuclease [Cupriavidus metallidurans]